MQLEEAIAKAEAKNIELIDATNRAEFAEKRVNAAEADKEWMQVRPNPQNPERCSNSTACAG